MAGEWVSKEKGGKKRHVGKRLLERKCLSLLLNATPAWSGVPWSFIPRPYLRRSYSEGVYLNKPSPAAVPQCQQVSPMGGWCPYYVYFPALTFHLSQSCWVISRNCAGRCKYAPEKQPIPLPRKPRDRAAHGTITKPKMTFEQRQTGTSWKAGEEVIKPS